MQRHTEQEIKKGFLLFLRLAVAGAAYFALLMQNRPTKFSENDWWGYAVTDFQDGD